MSGQQRVKAPDGTIHTFPADATPEQMAEAMREYEARAADPAGSFISSLKSQFKSARPMTAIGESVAERGPVERAAHGVIRGGLDTIAAVPKTIMGIAESARRPLAEQSVLDPITQTGISTILGLSSGKTEALPVVGPLAARAQEGDLAGALGEGAAMWYGPKMIGGAMRGIGQSAQRGGVRVWRGATNPKVTDIKTSAVARADRSKAGQPLAMERATEAEAREILSEGRGAHTAENAEYYANRAREAASQRDLAVQGQSIDWQNVLQRGLDELDEIQRTGTPADVAAAERALDQWFSRQSVTGAEDAAAIAARIGKQLDARYASTAADPAAAQINMAIRSGLKAELDQIPGVREANAIYGSSVPKARILGSAVRSAQNAPAIPKVSWMDLAALGMGGALGGYSGAGIVPGAALAYGTAAGLRHLSSPRTAARIGQKLFTGGQRTASAAGPMRAAILAALLSNNER